MPAKCCKTHFSPTLLFVSLLCQFLVSERLGLEKDLITVE